MYVSTTSEGQPLLALLLLFLSQVCQNDIWKPATQVFKPLICQHDIWGPASLWLLFFVPNMSAYLRRTIWREVCDSEWWSFFVFTESLCGSWCCSTIWPIVSDCFSLFFVLFCFCCIVNWKMLVVSLSAFCITFEERVCVKCLVCCVRFSSVH